MHSSDYRGCASTFHQSAFGMMWDGHFVHVLGVSDEAIGSVQRMCWVSLQIGVE